MTRDDAEQTSHGRRAPQWTVLPRGVALFLGLFSLLNSIQGAGGRSVDANLWWVDLRGLPVGVALAVLGATAVLLTGFGLWPRCGRVRAWATGLLVAGLVGATVANVAQVVALLRGGTVRAGFPVPLSAFTCLGLVGIVFALLRFRRVDVVPRLHGLWAALALGATLVLFPLLQMLCFGKTDYRRPADAIVVFGARAFADGRPSDVLADRVRTACALYHEGLAQVLVFSGGPGDGTVHETECMRRFARSLGVPDDAIVLDPGGVSTDATVEGTVRIFRERGIRRVLAVSHFYHLPRIKLRYQRDGWEVFTVPAEERYTLTAMPYWMCREVVALWVYYLEGVFR